MGLGGDEVEVGMEECVGENGFNGDIFFVGIIVCFF